MHAVEAGDGIGIGGRLVADGLCGANRMGLPSSGRASTYSSKNQGRQTASGELYSESGYTAALLPRSNWHAIPFGTKVKLTSKSRSVVVKINDRGAGAENIKTHANLDPTSVLDLSRQAMAYLIGKTVRDITDQNAGVISLDRIEIVSVGTAVGPVAGR